MVKIYAKCQLFFWSCGQHEKVSFPELWNGAFLDLPTANPYYSIYKLNWCLNGRNNHFSHHEIEPILLNRWPFTVKLHWLLFCINCVWLAIQSPTLTLLATHRTNNDEKCSRLKRAFRDCLLLRYTPTVKLCLRWKEANRYCFPFFLTLNVPLTRLVVPLYEHISVNLIRELYFPFTRESTLCIL